MSKTYRETMHPSYGANTYGVRDGALTPSRCCYPKTYTMRVKLHMQPLPTVGHLNFFHA